MVLVKGTLDFQGMGHHTAFTLLQVSREDPYNRLQSHSVTVYDFSNDL